MTSRLPDNVIEHQQLLHQGWRLMACAPGDLAGPSPTHSAWRAARVPGTVASSLHTNMDLPGNYDEQDWWYELRFAAPEVSAPIRYKLRFDGLATLAQVWLNDTPILTSDNMFTSHHVDVTALLATENRLVMVFRSLNAAMQARRARPRWKTALVAQQSLRWFRTTLMGRIPSWTPPITPVGPWRGIALERIEKIELTSLQIQAGASAGVAQLEIRATAQRLSNTPLSGARLRLGNDIHSLHMEQAPTTTITGHLTLPGVPLWWPHTHGAANLISYQLEVQTGDEWISLHCGTVGFKETTLNEHHGKVEFLINGVPIFCRGACWMPLDVLNLDGTAEKLRSTLEMTRAAGVNMLRVVGTMAYESHTFYALCDELGILVWQDFMFANMDYPLADPDFRASVETEVQQQLDRLQRHVCITAYCGGSEIAQQAAMLGLPAEAWSSDFFTILLPHLCAQRHAGIPYFPSTPWGGALPFHVGAGIAHYYGVGAYRRPLSDLKTAAVKFTSECLGFSNVPEPHTMMLLMDGATPPPHHPRWKARVPRDNGAGWDFEDVRDHYLKLLFGLETVTLRSADIERYYALSRVVSGEVMLRAFAEWRSATNPCAGALVWFLHDLLPGAGWGLIDSTGTAKAAFWYLKRAWAGQAIFFTDEGLDGLNIHVINESALTLNAEVELELFQTGHIQVGAASTTVEVTARGALTLQADALLGRFSDSTRAYCFGPPQHDVITVRMRDSKTKRLLSEDFYFSAGFNLPIQRTAQVRVETNWQDDGSVAVNFHSDTFLQSVSISCPNFTTHDNYFHVAPGQCKTLVFSATETVSETFTASFTALNFSQTIVARAGVPQRPAP